MTVDLSLRMLLHDRLRFVITVAGVAFSVALVLTQTGLFIGLLDNATVTIEHAGADLWVTSRNTPNIDFVHQFPETRVDRVRDIDGVERADNLVLAFVNVALPNGNMETACVYGLNDFKRWHLPWDVRSGDVDDLKRGPYVFFDDSATRRFGPFEVGDYREVQGRRLEIIGMSHAAKSFTTTPVGFMDLERLQALVPESYQGKTGYVLVKLAPGADAEAVKRAIRERLLADVNFILPVTTTRSPHPPRWIPVPG